jgi:AAHS family benzoate transporter-like MFS transporter
MAWISVAMLAAGLAPDLRWFAVARFCTGVGIGALAPLIGAYVTDNAPPRRRTLHLAISMGAIGIGGTASALLGRILLPDVEFQVLFLFGAVSLLLVPAIWWTVPPTPPAHAETTGARHRLAELVASGRRRVTVTLWAATFMSMVLVYSTTAWLPVVMMKSGYDLGSSLEFSIAFTLGASFGGLGVSLLGDRGHLVPVTFGCFLLAAVALFVLSTPQQRPLLLVMSAVAGLGSLGCQNMVIACMTASAPPRLRGSALGFGLGVGRVGAILGPTYLAVATDAFTSHRAGFFAFMVPAVLGAVTIALLPRRSLG